MSCISASIKSLHAPLRCSIERTGECLEKVRVIRTSEPMEVRAELSSPKAQVSLHTIPGITLSVSKQPGMSVTMAMLCSVGIIGEIQEFYVRDGLFLTSDGKTFTVRKYET